VTSDADPATASQVIERVGAALQAGMEHPPPRSSNGRAHHDA